MNDKALPAQNGVLLAAENGPLITYDPTGLNLRLSDRTLRDVSARLSKDESGFGLDPASLLPGIDVWDLFADGGFLGFHARLPNAKADWRFMRHRTGGAIFARSSGPVLGIFGYSDTDGAGPPLRHPYHVLRHPLPEARDRQFLRTIRRTTLSAAIADRLAQSRFEGYAPMRLILTQDEPLPPASDIDTYARNVRQAFAAEADRLTGVAAALEKDALVLAIALNVAWPDAPAVASLIQDMATLAGDADLGRPSFVTSFSTGTYWSAANAASFRAQSQLVWRSGVEPLIFAAPTCLYPQDALGQLTRDGLDLRACYEFHALRMAETWRPPVLAFAERDGDAIRLTFRADAPLTIDPSPPFARAPNAGFRLHGPEGIPLPHDAILSVERCADAAFLLRPSGAGADQVSYGWPDGSHVAVGNDRFQIGGAVRTTSPFAKEAVHGNLFQWALPSIVTVRE